MELTSKPVKDDKPTIVRDEDRCEATSYAGAIAQHRCTARGEMHSVGGGVTNGFARLCKRHVSTFVKAGFKVEPITPIDGAARGALGL